MIGRNTFNDILALPCKLRLHVFVGRINPGIWWIAHNMHFRVQRFELSGQRVNCLFNSFAGGRSHCLGK